MTEIKQISSLQNPLIKKVLLLKEKSRERKITGFFIIEGRRELELAIKGRYEIESVLFNHDIISQREVFEILGETKLDSDLFELSGKVYRKLAYRQTTEGLLAIAKAKSHALGNLEPKNKTPLILVAEAPEKPGNVGALLRTADAANLDAVIIANPKGDLYNPNIIRSSVGCIFTNNIAIGSTHEIIAYLKARNISICCAALSAAKNYTEVDYSVPTAIVVGTEATGLTSEWLEHCDENIIIPMQGEIDSMNVSVSAAILIFEAKRQRGF